MIATSVSLARPANSVSRAALGDQLVVPCRDTHDVVAAAAHKRVTRVLRVSTQEETAARAAMQLALATADERIAPDAAIDNVAARTGHHDVIAGICDQGVLTRTANSVSLPPSARAGCCPA